MLKKLQQLRNAVRQFCVNSFTVRTHTCGELRVTHAGERVTLCGWLDRVRGDKFLLLRDSYGHTQLLLPEFMQKRKSTYIPALESVLRVSGMVQERPEKDINQKMPTGQIEVAIEEMEVLNRASSNLPFEVKDEYNAVKEERVRLKHRYLDMRRPEIQKILRLRSDIVYKMRKFLTETAKFVEVETPILFRRTPGGAREFIVPTRYEGRFYSLPQSPQQFKQMLMVGGIDRYFQIAKCFRDEVSASDRQPEFSQVDLELSFTSQKQVMSLVEQLLLNSWPNHLPSLTVPFTTMTYNDALRLYGTDKPDTRFNMQITDLSDYLNTLDQGPFQKSLRKDQTDWNWSCIVLDRGAGLISRRQRERWNTSLKFHGYARSFDIVSVESMGQWRGSFSKNLINRVKLGINERIGALPGDAILFSWGPSANAVRQTLGYLRLKAAEFLEKECDRTVRDKTRFDFLWITEFPLFHRDQVDGSLECAHHPFTAPIVEHYDSLLSGDEPSTITGQHYDLVLNGTELGGGSIRIHDADTQKFVLENILGETCDSMKYFVDALDSGAPPHGGIALGLDRYLAVLTGQTSIRDVMAFPKSCDGIDTMSGAPSQLSTEDLQHYGIAVTQSNKGNHLL